MSTDAEDGDPCANMQLLVQADLDGELDAAGAAALAGHVARCERCAALQSELGALSASLRGKLTRHVAPSALRAAIDAQQPRRKIGWSHGASFGAGMALAAGIAAFAVLPGRGGLDGDSVAAHIRALQPGHLMDVESTDRHTVKPWFDGRLDYAPPVRDFAAQGFPLIGGRLDYLAGRPVAALVYRRDKHVIDVFVWPGVRSGTDATIQGYNVIAWSQDGMNFRAVSDLNTGEMANFSKLMRSPGD
jgi:anti-sigma factor RsiW